MRWLLIGAILVLAALGPSDARTYPNIASATFSTHDVWISSSAGLGAYQLQVIAPGATLVGVESGEVPFDDAPFYDPKAMSGGRVIIAGIKKHQTFAAAPMHRVATLHFLSAEAPLQTKLIAAGDASGNRITPTVQITKRVKQ